MESRIYYHLMDWARGRKAMPLQAEIFLTERCNLRCRFCNTLPQGVSFDKEGLRRMQERELSHERILAIIEECIQNGVVFFYLNGGEPLLRKKTLFEAMEVIKCSGARGVFITNGTLLKAKDIETIVRVGWDAVIFSLDSTDPAIHDDLRGIEGSYKKTLSAMKRVKTEKVRQDRPDVNMIVNMVITNKNYLGIPEMVRLAHEMNCYELLLQPLMEVNADCRELKLSKAQTTELQDVLLKAKEINEEYGIRTNLESFIDPKYIQSSDNVHAVLLSDMKAFRKDLNPSQSTGPAGENSQGSTISSESE